MGTIKAKTKSCDQSLDKALKLSELAVKDSSNHQTTEDGIIRIGVGTSRTPWGILTVPVRNSVRAEPESDAASIFQRLVILLPVGNSVLGFLLRGACILLECHF